MKNIYILFLILLNFNYCFSQLENNNWHFGHENAIRINNPSTIINTSQIESIESPGSVSDSNGNLLFYTNGATVWNSENEVMLNGIGLFGGPSASQLVIVPHPGNNNQYYIITSREGKVDILNGAYYYSIVDMSQEGGLGEVILLNEPLLTQDNNPVGFGQFSAEAITVINNVSNSEYLVLIPHQLILFTFIINVNGINNTAHTENELTNNFIAGTIKASADGTQIALCSFQNFIDIYSFNANNATLGSLNYSFDDFDGGQYAYTTEFSPNGNLLYATSISYTITNPNQLLVINPSTNTFNNLLPPSGVALRAGIQRIQNNNFEMLVSAEGGLFAINNPNSFTSSSIVATNYTLTGTSNTYVVGLPQLVPERFSLSCTPHLIVTTSVNSPNTDLKQASNSITASNEINSGATAIYHAGSLVLLTDGFHSDSGSIFRGYIENCSDTYAGKNSNNNDVKDTTTLAVHNSKEFTIYPNPSNSKITIETSNYLIDEIAIYSIDGKEVFFKKNNPINTMEIDISSFTNGLYLIRAKTSNGEIFTEKVMKN